MPALQHPRLDRNRRQIRLLRLLHMKGPGGRLNRRIRVQLCTFNLHSAPRYSALSYTWGTRTSNRSIIVNNGVLEVGDNLYRFLTDFKKSETKSDSRKRKRQWLWIDQVCIDQNNAEEKNHQVRMMAQIYSRAMETLIWLSENVTADNNAVSGPYTPQISLKAAFEALLPYMLLCTFARGRRSLRSRCENIWERERLCDIFSVIRNNRYFTRRWTIQEIILAKRIRIFVQGGLIVPWYHLCGLTMILQTQHPDMLESESQPLYETHAPRISGLHDDFSWCIERYAGYKCTEPLDRVYSLLGVIKKEVSEQITVDYNKTLNELLLDLAGIYLRAGRESLFKLSETAFELDLDREESYAWRHLTTILRGDVDLPRGPLPYHVGMSDAAEPGSVTFGYSPSMEKSDTHPSHSHTVVACWWYHFNDRTKCFPCGVYEQPPACSHTARVKDGTLRECGLMYEGDRNWSTEVVEDCRPSDSLVAPRVRCYLRADSSVKSRPPQLCPAQYETN